MLLFIDESGHDMRSSPYYVLAGIAIDEKELWSFTQSILDLEQKWFGVELRNVDQEIKGSKLLKKDIFQFASQSNFVKSNKITRHTRNFLTKGYLKEEDPSSEYNPTADEFKSYGLACKRFSHELFNLCQSFDITAFASLVEHQKGIETDGLRKDYGYLFERYDNFLQEHKDEVGMIVFDEQEKSQSHLLLDQMGWYFTETNTGKSRVKRIVPEPFFVHSDLTKPIQVADVLAYVLNWGLRLEGMDKPERDEITPFAKKAFELNYHGEKTVEGEKWTLFGYTYIEDLRTERQRKE